MVSSTLSITPTVEIGTKNPYFVGLALLRSLMMHEEVAAMPKRSDAVLDMIALLHRQAPAQQVLQAFCQVRQACGTVCYLALFRLRRWLESQVCVQAGDQGTWEPVRLAFSSYPRLVQDWQRQVWESQVEVTAISDIPVHFAWAGVSEPDATLAHALA